MCNVTFQTFILLMNTIVAKAKIQKNQNVDISTRYIIYIYQMKGPALTEKFFLNSNFSRLFHPQATNQCPKKMSAHSVQPFDRPEGTYIRMSCFIIQITQFKVLKLNCQSQPCSAIHSILEIFLVLFRYHLYNILWILIKYFLFFTKYKF